MLPEVLTASGLVPLSLKDALTFDKRLAEIFRLDIGRINIAIFVQILDRLTNVKRAKNVAAGRDRVTHFTKLLLGQVVSAKIWIRFRRCCGTVP